MFVNYEILDISPDIPLDILNKSAVAFLPGILYIYVYHIYLCISSILYMLINILRIPHFTILLQASR